MDGVIDGLSDLTKHFMEQNPNMNFDEFKNTLIKISPGFATNKIFNDVIFSIYQIEKIQLKMKNDKKWFK